MAFKFKAEIYKVGINPVVEVPTRVTAKLLATKGYINVKGKINGHAFHQTLCPIKGGPYRLYVNGPMMKGAKIVVGDEAQFQIEQDEKPPQHDVPMPPALLNRLKEEKLLVIFESMIPSRKKEVCRYLNYLKTEESLRHNIEKLILNLKAKGIGTPWAK